MGFKTLTLESAAVRVKVAAGFYLLEQRMEWDLEKKYEAMVSKLFETQIQGDSALQEDLTTDDQWINASLDWVADDSYGIGRARVRSETEITDLRARIASRWKEFREQLRLQTDADWPEQTAKLFAVRENLSFFYREAAGRSRFPHCEPTDHHAARKGEIGFAQGPLEWQK